MPEPRMTVDELNAWSPGTFVALLGIRIVSVEPGRLTSEMQVRTDLIAPNGYLHAGSLVTLADTSAGFGCRAHLPEGASGFTTVELKSNFLGTAREGVLDCVATMEHGGRTTQIWDAVVVERSSGRRLALFRCTQMILYPQQA